jgi:hypothetical protein
VLRSWPWQGSEESVLRVRLGSLSGERGHTEDCRMVNLLRRISYWSSRLRYCSNRRSISPESFRNEVAMARYLGGFLEAPLVLARGSDETKIREKTVGRSVVLRGTGPWRVLEIIWKGSSQGSPTVHCRPYPRDASKLLLQGRLVVLSIEA